MGFLDKIFKRRFNYNKKRDELLEQVERAMKAMKEARNYEVLAYLKKLFDRLDDIELILDKGQCEKLEEKLKYIKGHGQKEYATVVRSKCEEISKIISGEISNKSKSEEVFEQNDDKIHETAADLTLLERQISEIKAEKDKALDDGDRIKWEMLNSELKRLEKKYENKKCSFKLWQGHQDNLSAGIAMNDTKRVADEIDNQSAYVDIASMENDAETVKEVAKEINETRDRIDAIFADTFGSGSNDSFEYERAREAKLSKEKLEDKNEGDLSAEESIKETKV